MQIRESTGHVSAARVIGARDDGEVSGRIGERGGRLACRDRIRLEDDDPEIRTARPKSAERRDGASANQRNRAHIGCEGSLEPRDLL